MPLITPIGFPEIGLIFYVFYWTWWQDKKAAKLLYPDLMKVFVKGEVL
jgi:hypothetical protein